MFQGKINTILKPLIVFTLLLNIELSHAQHNNNYAFGLYSGITFNTSPPSIIQTKIKKEIDTINYAQGAVSSSSYSNCKGELIVYGSGIQLWNRLHKPLLNGIFQNCQTKYECPMIPMPGSKRYLFYFYLAIGSGFSSCKDLSLQYAIIDLNGDNGLGEVIIKNQVLDSNINGGIGSGGNNITYTLHQNKKDIWIVHAAGHKTAKSYLLNDTGINKTPITSNNIFSGNYCYSIQKSINSTYFLTDGRSISHIKFTNDGKNLISTGIDSSVTKDGCSLMYDFDKLTGKFSNQKVLLKFSDIPPLFFSGVFNKGNYLYCAVSPNDSFIYLSSRLYCTDIKFNQTLMSNIYKINRYTLEKTLIKKFNFLTVGLSLGPDGNIYTFTHDYAPFGLLALKNPNTRIENSQFEFVLRDSNLFYPIAFPFAFQPYYKLYYSSNLQSNPCADTAIFDIHADTGFSELRILFGDGDSMVFNPPFASYMRIKHVYTKAGRYGFTMKGLTPGCNYFAKTGDSLDWFNAPERLGRLSFIKPECDATVMRISDSVLHTSETIYDWAMHGSDTFYASASDTNIHQSKKTLLKQGSAPFVLLKLKLRNNNCPQQIIYTDTLIPQYLPAMLSALTVQSDVAFSMDTLQGKKRFIACSPVLWQVTDTAAQFKSAFLLSADTAYAIEYRQFLTLGRDTGLHLFVLNDSNVYGCADKDSFYLHTLPAPELNTTYPVMAQCLKGNRFSIRLTPGQQSAFAGRLHWGDGDSAAFYTDTVLWHRYASKGNYTVSWALRAFNTCIENKDSQAIVHPMPDTAFSVWPLSQCHRSNSIQWSGGNDSIHNWSFGDGSAAATRSGRHSYTEPGRYILTHISSNASQCSDTQKAVLFILPDPVAGITPDDTVLCQGKAILNAYAQAFCDSAVSLIQTLHWGDGDSSVLTGNGYYAHTFSLTGKTRLRLTAKTSYNCTDTAYTDLDIKPFADIDIRMQGHCLGDTSVFTANENSGKALLSHIWYINGQEVGNGDALRYSFPSTGLFKVQLTCISDTFCEASDSIAAEIVRKPLADFEYVPAYQRKPFNIYFRNRSVQANAFYWAFGDGDTSMRVSPVHGYNDSGMYKVRLIASNQILCFDTLYREVPVLERIVFYLPSAFSPDGNLNNESFGLSASQTEFVSMYELKIYNRWGEAVFKTLDKHEHWNAGNAQQGIYVYTLNIRDVYNILHELKGVVEVLK